MSLLAAGVMPSASMLAAAGMSESEAMLWLQASTPGANTPVASPGAPAVVGGAYDNGILSESEISRFQQHINQYRQESGEPLIAVDGKWGRETQDAANGLTADEYARIYYKQNAWSGRSDR